jgi:hypothetical protein
MVECPDRLIYFASLNSMNPDDYSHIFWTDRIHLFAEVAFLPTTTTATPATNLLLIYHGESMTLMMLMVECPDRLYILHL